jgi:ATP-binding cassette subfamily B protein
MTFLGNLNYVLVTVGGGLRIASAERGFGLHHAHRQPPDPARPYRPATITGAVEFSGVSFRYRPDQPLIENPSPTVHPGQTDAIVGPTGAGKTTLVNLLLRFHEPDAGTITLDECTSPTVLRRPPHPYRQCVQDTWLFGGTIADNIAYGKPGATATRSSTPPASTT